MTDFKMYLDKYPKKVLAKLVALGYKRQELIKDNPVFIYVLQDKFWTGESLTAFNNSSLKEVTADYFLNNSKEFSTDTTDNKDTDNKFKPFQKVLVRDTDTSKWGVNLFERYNNDNALYKHICMSGAYSQCIPYKGNKHLLGTTNKPTI